MMIYVRYGKSIFDFIGAVILLICLAPVLLLVITILLVTQGKSIIFQQERSGQHIKHFDLYKFRTLEKTSKDTLSLHGRKYTRTGKFLRRSGLDELPQLINIIKGDMSFIGPRPLPIEYEEKYSTDMLIRFDLKPGLTGWAQVNGRNETSWAKRFELDHWYIDHVSAMVDFKILLKTISLLIKTILGKEQDEVTMEVFKGIKLI